MIKLSVREWEGGRERLVKTYDQHLFSMSVIKLGSIQKLLIIFDDFVTILLSIAVSKITAMS